MAELFGDLSSDLVQNITHYGGSEGERWLTKLPDRVKALTDHWQLTDVQPMSNLSFNFVAQAKQAGQPVVLKIGWETQSIRRETGWLLHYSANTEGLVVPVLAQDGDNAYLMPKLTPGIGADNLPDETSTAIIGECIRKLYESGTRIPEDITYPTIEDWFSALPRASETARRSLGTRIDKAQYLANELSKDTEVRLLHGDLHHHNILQDHTHWIITDPQGVMGDPTHECAAMLRNALASIKGSVSIGVQRRVDQLASITNFDARRIAAWGYAQNVLSCVWSLDADPETDVSAVVAVVDVLDKP